jgi:hypothetical protein
MSGRGVLVLACGALVRELTDIAGLHQLDGVSIECLPASLHNRPEHIPDQVRARLAMACDQYEKVLVGYADCGTGGLLDRVCEEFEVERLPGAHCYEFFAGAARFAAVNDPDPTAFYLTDYLARHFDRLIYQGLGIADHPELRDMYFGNYTRMVLFAQRGGAEVLGYAAAASERIGLPLEIIETGYGELESTVLAAVRPLVARAVGLS